ncbi:hypothetical protein PRZ48_009397 [Zasmidium cellare]|uniref:Uncharacterized protein n=1 Tax=Zasmidium cellare TaxID=395010 RepID=A0ABR0EBN3_ZASCE|nr:hypothetical protein PRZ48_009397 [Zasmidium cellare]
MAGSEQSRDVFRFFDLPLEMREMIYDESLQEREGSLKCRGLDYKASNMPRVNLLLVSKRFKQEYKARVRKAGQILVLQDTYDSIRPDFFGLPYPRTMYTSIIVNIHIHPDDPEAEFGLHEDWMPALMRSLAACPGDVTLQFNIQMCRSDIASGEYQQELEKLVCKLALLSPVCYHVNIYGASRDWARNTGSGLKSDSILSMMWSREKQKLERIPVAVAES